MKLFDFLKVGGRGAPAKKSPLARVRTVEPPGAARREKLAREQAEEAALKAQAKEREYDPFDTGSLEMAREPSDGDNPYDTQSWQINAPQAPRRVDDLKAINKDRKSGQRDNPYDTIVSRKGW